MLAMFFKRTIPTAVAMAVGALVLIGALLPMPRPGASGIIPILWLTRFVLIRWAMVLAAFAFFLGFLHLLRVHLVRLGRRAKGWSTSLLILVSACVTLTLVLWQGAEGQLSRQLFDNILVPGESALFALTAVTLILAGMRIFRVRRTAGSALFLAVALIVLIGTVPYVGFMGDLASWIQTVPALAGMRGLLLGVALGTILSGMRVIVGLTRPHSDD